MKSEWNNGEKEKPKENDGMIARYKDHLTVFAILFGLLAAPVGYGINAWTVATAEEVAEKQTQELKQIVRDIVNVQRTEQQRRERVEADVQTIKELQRETRDDIKTLLRRD